MQYLYHPEAGAETLTLEGESYRHLFKVRRARADTVLHLRNLKDDRLHSYRTVSLDRRRARLHRIESRELRIAPSRFLHLGWCLIDPKSIEKVLPSLNEIGVTKITFIRCVRSQRNFRLDLDRLRRILVHSSEQCGRSVLMELAEAESLDEFLKAENEAGLLDFSEQVLGCGETLKTLIIGPEGGYDDTERSLFSPERIYGFATATILRSESAACAAAARLLL